MQGYSIEKEGERRSQQTTANGKQTAWRAILDIQILGYSVFNF